jgi:hypothetical protein
LSVIFGQAANYETNKHGRLTFDLSGPP